jgi:hypothetical protein
LKLPEGNPAILCWNLAAALGPVAFRPPISQGLAFSSELLIALISWDFSPELDGVTAIELNPYFVSSFSHFEKQLNSFCKLYTVILMG